MIAIYSFTVGVFSVGLWPDLPGAWFVTALFVFVLLLFYLKCKAVACLLLGMCYAISWGHFTLSHQLPEEFTPSEFLVTGEIVGLPSVDDRRIQFHLRVLDNELLEAVKPSISGNAGLRPTIALQKLRLSWYNQDLDLVPGQIWQLRVKLRRPRGSVNPGGFDYQAWLLRQGISATGYVRGEYRPGADAPNRLLAPSDSLSRHRFFLRQAIQGLPLDKDQQALVLALTLGDRSQIASELWDLLSLSGVIHLMVISGLHVGLVALFFYGFGVVIARCFGVFGLCLTARYYGSLCSLLGAAGYAWIAGMSLPTQRALVMISVLIIAVLLNRKLGRVEGYGWALAIVAVIDPLAFLGAGFWLSFGAVACLLWLLPSSNANGVGNPSFFARRVLALRQFAQIQWLVFLSLFTPLCISQLPVSWMSPLVNLVAIPWVSFGIVPLCLIATLLFPLNSAWAGYLWVLAGDQLGYFLTFLQHIPTLSFAPRFLPLPSSLPVYLSLVLMFILLLLPRGIPCRYLGVLMFTSLALWPENRHQSLRVSVLDVGQGLSVVVQTLGESGRHVLVYDAGPGYPSGFNMGDSVVAPYLRSQGMTKVNTLVVSHGDKDHSGGIAGLMKFFVPEQLFYGEDPILGEKVALNKAVDGRSIPSMTAIPSESLCQSGYGWQWDQVSFQFLHPPLESSTEQRTMDGASFSDEVNKHRGTLLNSNNRSCVLQINLADQTILLPGDIESMVEHELLKNPELQVPITVLVAAHHGSKSSSSARFIKAAKPNHVVFSAGYRHHFGHPARTVVERYTAQGSDIWNTAEQGAVEFHWDEGGKMTVTTGRTEARRYWY